MSSTNLLNIDVDKLFEQHNVADINQIHKRLQTEVETKREELRVMVGERYRDLLKAADTIFLMKDSSASVVDQMVNINVNCKSLNEMQLFGFKATTNTGYSTDRSLSKQLTTFYSTAAQTKILTNLHSLIWKRLDNEEFFLAAQLFILARHIHTGLQLDNSNEFTSYFPIAQTQWEMLEPFYSTIKKKLLPVLERENLSAVLATDCLLSLYLLEKSTLDSTLQTFMQQRSKAYMNSLASDQSKQRRVKERILASLKVLISTVDLVSRCFVSDGAEAEHGLLHLEIEKFACKNTPPTINLVAFEDKEMLKTIPDIIAKFKPSIMPPKLTSDIIKSASENWMKSVEDVTNNELKNLIELISSMKTIQDLKKESLCIEKDQNWSEKCLNFHLSSTLDFYKEKYLVLINQRIQDIIRQSWSKCISQSFQNIQQMLMSSSAIKRTTINSNEFSYLWTEDFTDVPKSLKQALSNDKCSNKLLIKTKGFSLGIVGICIEFDNLLKEIFTEMNVLLEETDGGKTENKQSLIEFLRNTSEEHTTDLITQIKSLNLVERSTENCAIIAKLLVAFIDLCPNFKLCLSYNPNTANDWKEHSNLNTKQTFENWQRICNLLDEESFVMWKRFCDLLFKEFLANDMTLNKHLELKNILEDFVTWDTISIEEKDEHENIITSAIRIPSQPRINLQQFLFKLIRKLNEKIPQTLPPKVLKHLTLTIIEYFLDHYTTIVIDDLVTTNQNLALQLYFDLKFMQIIFTDRDDRKILETFLKLTNSLKSCIDPFDFELFHSHLGGNIKKCSLRMYQELGILIPHSENLHYLADLRNSTTTTTTSSLDKDPNVLTLSSCGANSTWFPLLPVISTVNKSGINPTEICDTVSSSSKSTTKISPNRKILNAQQQTTAQNYASNVKSGAAAFFGAMGQDWFR